MIRVAINGFGRIGRNFLRTVMQDQSAQDKIKVVAINIGPARADAVAHMFKYDTIMGTYSGNVQLGNGELIVDGHHIKILTELDPSKCGWPQLQIGWVVEASGKFTKREGAIKHLDAGASYVLITAPAKQEDISIILGVNEGQFDKEKHKIVSLGSCTTSAFIPMIKVLHDAFKITRGFMTSMHAYTNSQVLLDVENSDLRRSRAAALNIIPTTTGASKMLGKIMPELDGLLLAMSLRVPVGNVSLIDLTFEAGQELTIETIHGAFKDAMLSRMKGMINLIAEPLVSSDFIGTKYSVEIDGLLTKAQGTLGKVFGWYDNEWGYSMRLKDFLLYVNQL